MILFKLCSFQFAWNEDTLNVLGALWSSSDDDFNFIGVGKSSIASSLEDWNLKSDGGGR